MATKKKRQKKLQQKSKALFVLGLTSGIGAGKSTVAGMFRALGAKVIGADRIVQRLYSKNRMLRKRIVAAFGKRAVERAQVNRRFLAQAAFPDVRRLKRLNAIVHPLVKAEIYSELKKLNKKLSNKKFFKIKKKPGVVVLDVPLLFESGMNKICDAVAVVKAPLHARAARMLKRSMPRKEFMRRLKAQMPLHEKVKLADFVIDNSGSPAATRRQARSTFRLLRNF